MALSLALAAVRRWVKRRQHRVADPRIHRLIHKWLKAGVSEEGEWSETKVGTPQGAVISPLLANIYLHYVFDQWIDAWRKRMAKGEVIVVRYADDLVLGFEHREDAERFLDAFRERLAKFGLELQPDKTRLIEFGRNAETNRGKRGERKPETFDFLGFTHYCGTKKGRFIVWRKTASKRLRAKLLQLKQELRRRMHQPLAQVPASALLGGVENHWPPQRKTDALGSLLLDVRPLGALPAYLAPLSERSL